jgi:hypothetical protein
VITAIYDSGYSNLGAPTDEEQATVEAAAGLSSITNVSMNNGTVAVPNFTSGTTSPVVITATKVDESSLTTWSFDATDSLGQMTFCG